MKEYLVKIPEAEVETVSHVLEKFGVEMSPVKIKEEKKRRTTKTKSPGKTRKEKIDHTYLFGKWKDFDIDVKKIREELWKNI